MACAIIISRHDKRGEGVERSRGRRETMRVWRFVFLLLLVAAAAAASAAWWWLHRPLSLATDPVELSIELGADAARDRRGLGPGRRQGRADPALRMVPLVGTGAQDPRRQLRGARGHDADRPAREDGARRRDPGRRPLHRRLDLPPGPRRARQGRGPEADPRRAERCRGHGSPSARRPASRPRAGSIPTPTPTARARPTSRC